MKERKPKRKRKEVETKGVETNQAQVGKVKAQKLKEQQSRVAEDTHSIQQIVARASETKTERQDGGRRTGGAYLGTRMEGRARGRTDSQDGKSRKGRDLHVGGNSQIK